MFSTFGEKSAVGEKEVLTKKYVVVRERDLESGSCHSDYIIAFLG